MSPREKLLRIVEAEAHGPVPPAVAAAAEGVRRRYGRAAAAIVFYGSCRRGSDYRRGIVDFYVLVDRYRDAHGKWLPTALNALLPPNVYYVKVPFADHAVRVKCAVMSVCDFVRGASGFQPSVWARFAQPCTLAWVRDAEIRSMILTALAVAVETTIIRTAPLLEPEFTTRRLWTRAFAESYRCEWRAERPEQTEALYAAAEAYYERVTDAVVSTASLSVITGSGTAARFETRFSWVARMASKMGWMGRRLLGKTLAALRLAKAAFTFEGGVDYVLWKLERHSGVLVALTPWQRRHPLLAAPILMWRLYRRDILR